MNNYPGTVPPQHEEDLTARNGQADNAAPGPASYAPPAYTPPPDYVPNQNLPATQPPYPDQGWQPPYDPYSGVPAPPPPPAYQYPAPGEVQAAPDNSRRTIITGAIAVGLTILGIAGFVVGGEPGKFMEVGIQFIPFVVLALLAYGGVKSSQAAVFAYICLFIVEGLLLLNVVANVFLATVTDFEKLQAWEVNPTSVPISEVFKPNTGIVLLLTVFLLGVVSIVALLMLARPVRVVMARLMPIDPDNFVHKIALSVLTMLTLSSFVPLIVLGSPPILAVVSNPTFSSAAGDTGISVRPQDLIYQFVWMIPSTLIGAGWLVARKLPDVLKRLGMVKPTLLQVCVGLVLGVVFAFASNYLDMAINWLFTTMGWATTDTGAFSQLLEQVTALGVVGAALIGITAGLGEEMAVRGLLQPRLGLIASNLVFTSLHAFQYGLDGLLSVFIVGLALGIIRWRSNTTTSAIVHGTYDFAVVLATVLHF